MLAAVGTALPLAALAVTAAVPATVDPRWFAVVLAVDVAAIALIRGDVPSIGVSALFTLPALWRATRFGFPGAATDARRSRSACSGWAHRASGGHRLR